MALFDPLRPNDALGATTESGVPHREGMHELGLLLLAVIHDIASVAVAVFGAFVPALIVGGESIVDFLEEAKEEWVDHREVVDDHSHEGFTDSPGASLLSAVDRILGGMAELARG